MDVFPLILILFLNEKKNKTHTTPMFDVLLNFVIKETCKLKYQIIKWNCILIDFLKK
jgi:hypothetical protein